jgi:hypothetical protein
VDQQLRKLEVLAAAGRPATLLRGVGTPGLIYCFVPAHGESRVGAVQQELNRTWTEDLGLTVLPADFNRSDFRSLRTVVLNLSEDARRARGVRRLDGKTWGAFLRPEHGKEILDASQAEPRETGRLLDFARRHYDVVSVDLTGAREAHATEVIRESTSVFFVSDSDEASISMVCDKVAWLRSLRLEESASLMIHRVPGGLSTAAIEDITGVSVCGLIDSSVLVRSLAIWLAAEREFRLAAAV